jgi:hypothetical protein
LTPAAQTTDQHVERATPVNWLVARVAVARGSGYGPVLWIESAPPVRIAERLVESGPVAMVTPPRHAPLTANDLPAPHASFDMVVLAHVLSAAPNVDDVLGRVSTLLPVDGLLLVEELCWDRLDLDTGRWFFGFQDAIARERGCRASKRLLADRLNDWRAEHAGLHPGATIARELERHFGTESLQYGPHLGELLDWDDALEYEREAIDAGVIAPTCLRFAGRPRPLQIAGGVTAAGVAEPNR